MYCPNRITHLRDIVRQRRRTPEGRSELTESFEFEVFLHTRRSGGIAKQHRARLTEDPSIPLRRVPGTAKDLSSRSGETRTLRVRERGPRETQRGATKERESKESVREEEETKHSVSPVRLS